MSRIQTVKPNFQPSVSYKPSSQTNASKVGKNPSFTGGLNPQQKNMVWEALVSKFKFINKLSETAGEIQNIIFIGLGTALVAPIFIAYNPLSKQDDKTKKYSALRQPISAVIATATGIGVNMPIAAYFNKMAAEGKFKTFDMQAKPASGFLKDRYNSIIKHFDKMNERDKKYFDMVNDGTIKDAKSFTQKYPTFQEFTNGVHEVTKKQAALKLLDPNNAEGLRNTTLKEFMVKHMGVKEHPFETTQLNPDFMKRYMKETSAVSFLKSMGINIDEAGLRTFLGKNFYKDRFDAEITENKNLAEDLFKIIKKNAKEEDFKGLDADKIEELFKNGLSKQGFNDRERKTISRLCELWVDEKAKGEEKIPVKTLFKVLGIEDDFHKHNCLTQKMDEFLLWMDKNLTEGVQTKATGSEIKKTAAEAAKETAENGNKLIKYAGQIASNAVSLAEKKLSSYSKVQGIILSLAILPASCGILNWSYPRIMEKFFPKLTDAKPDTKAAPKGDTVEIKKGGK